MENTQAADAAGFDIGPWDNVSVYPVPVPVVDPTIGNGVVLVALSTFQLGHEASSTPRSSVGLAVGRTDTDSKFGGAMLDLHLDDDRTRVSGMAGAGAFNLEFFGIGGDSILADRPLDFHIEGTFARLGVSWRVAENMFVGPVVKALDTRSRFNLLPGEIDRSELDAKLMGVGLTTVFDTRDTQYSPHDGSYAEVEVTRFEDGLGSDFSFSAFDASLAQYVEMKSDLVGAWNVRVASATDGAPFFALPFVNVRGFSGGQHLDHVIWQAQGELRWHLVWRIGLVGFFGMGQTAEDLGEFGDGPLLYAGGAGVRLVLSPTERIVAGMDYAISGDGDHALYFRVGEAF